MSSDPGLGDADASRMDSAEFAVKMYDAVSSHFLVRVRQRDAVLLFYVASVGTIYGLTSEQGSLGKEFLLSIPYIGCVCGVMMAYHSLFIEALMKYCQEDLARRLGELRVFETSRMYATVGMRAVLLRSAAYVLLLLLPVFLALWETRTVVAPALWWAAGAVGIVGLLSVFSADLTHVLNVRQRVRAMHPQTPG